MKPSDSLHQLIHSMSMSEKRYFKIYASRHVVGETNNYQRLFDAIDKQEQYDEDALHRRFAGERFLRHLPSEKNYLYHQVLDSLNVFNRDKTFLSRYANILVAIESLYNRGLFAQCHKLIRKAKTEAYSIEKLSILLVILRWETLVYIKDEDGPLLNKSMLEELRVMEMIRVQSALMRIAFHLQVQIDKGNTSATFLRESEKELKQNLPATPEVDSFWAKYYYHSSMGLINSVRSRQQERYHCYHAIKMLMDEAPQFIVDLPGIYHLNLNNLVNVQLFLGKFSEAEQLIRQQRNFMHDYKIKRPALEKIVFLNTAESELYLHYKTGRYEKGVSVLRSFETEVRKMDIQFSPLIFDLLFMMAVTELTVHNFAGATKWLNKMLNAERNVYFRKELRINARLLYLIILYESDDRLLDNRMNAARRYLAGEKLFPTQAKILEAIRLLSEGASGARARATLLRLRAEIRKAWKKSNEESLNKQFDFAGWLDEKVKG